jgi:PKD repeat protein
MRRIVVLLGLPLIVATTVGSGGCGSVGLQSVLEDCVADFSVETTETEKGVLAEFTDKSRGDITRWRWDFDEDRKIDSREQNPTHLFTKNGTYDVKLIVTASNCEGDLSKTTRLWIRGCPT